MEIMNDQKTRVIRRETFTTKKAALKAHSALVRYRRVTPHAIRILYYPS